MKFLAPLLLFLAFAETTSAQIQFKEDLAFATILDQAKKEDKLIFMDCYTTWCGPCKWLVKNVFSDEKVAEMYNGQFINFKSDMEKGEGIDLAKKFDIQMYPTLLWLNGDGEVVFRVVGTNTVDGFLEFATNLKDAENQFPAMVKKFEAGNRNPDFLKKLANTATVGYYANAYVYVEEYLNTVPKETWTSEENISLLYAACKTFDSKTTKYILENASKFDSELVESIKSQCLDNELRTVLESKSEEKLKTFFALIEKYASDRQDYKQTVELYFYRTTGNRSKLNELTSKYLKVSKDAELLNEYAWERFENETNTVLLKEAIVWAERSVKLDKQYYNTDTLGQLYQKIGNKKKAAKWLKESKRLEPVE